MVCQKSTLFLKTLGLQRLNFENFLHHTWNRDVNDVPHSAILNPFLWNELHNFNGFLHHVWNMNVGLFSETLLSSLLRRLSFAS